MDGARAEARATHEQNHLQEDVVKLRNYRKAPLALALAALALVGCEDNGSMGVDGEASVRVLLTDAPADYIAAAWVDIGAVQLVAPEGGDGPPITLTDDGTEGMVDLLQLQDAATAELANLAIEPGVYSQLRLIVDSAAVELAEGYTFRDGSSRKTLFVPSGAQTGIKLNLGAADDDEEHGIRIAGGETVLVLDFDVSQSFVIQGNAETPAGIRGVLFTPTLRVTVEDVAARITGTVSAADDSITVAGLTVTAEPVDEGILDAYQSTTATATTADDGSYTIHFLVPGSYTVTVAVPEGFATDPASADVTVEKSGEATGADFVIDEAAAGS